LLPALRSGCRSSVLQIYPAERLEQVIGYVEDVLEQIVQLEQGRDVLGRQRLAVSR